MSEGERQLREFEKVLRDECVEMAERGQLTDLDADMRYYAIREEFLRNLPSDLFTIPAQA